MKKARDRFIKNLRYFCLIGVIALGLMTIIGTGGGGGGAPPPDLGTAPKINNVELLKWDGNDWVVTTTYNIGDTANFYVYASDPDLDLSTLTVSQYYPHDSSTPYYGPDSVSLGSQPTADLIVYLITPITVEGPAGNWRIEFQLADAKGNESNVFIGYSVVL